MKFRKLIMMMVIGAIMAGLLAGCGTSAGQGEAGTTGVQAGAETGTEAAKNEAGNTLQLNKALPTGDLGRITKVNDREEYTQEDVERVDRAIRAYTPSVSEGLLINNATSYYYYDQLTSPVKDFYEAMYMIAEDPVSADYYIKVDAGTVMNEEDFYSAYYMAYQALCFDHPELFWLYNYSKTSIVAGSEDGQNIYFSIEKSYTDFEKDMTAFNNAVDAFLAKVDTSASDQDKARQIHDLLCETVTYDYEVLEMGTSEEGYTDLAHSAYGVLVENSRGMKNTAVCDGYSLAYAYLLQQCGIEAVVVPGKAGSDLNSLGGHAWNVVNLDGSWYEIDSTWDDNMMELRSQLTPDVDGYEYFDEALSDPVYSDHLNHYLYGLTTQEIREYVPVEEDYYTTKDGKYQICLTGESYHYRANEFDDMGGDGDLAGELPEAMAGSN